MRFLPESDLFDERRERVLQIHQASALSVQANLREK